MWRYTAGIAEQVGDPPLHVHTSLLGLKLQYLVAIHKHPFNSRATNAEDAKARAFVHSSLHKRGLVSGSSDVLTRSGMFLVPRHDAASIFHITLAGSADRRALGLCVAT